MTDTTTQSKPTICHRGIDRKTVFLYTQKHTSLFLILCASVALFSSCSTMKAKRIVANATDTSVSGSKVVLWEDDFIVWFHGDGAQWVILEFSDEKFEVFEQRIRENGIWNPLPVPVELEQLANARKKQTKEAFFPNAQNGWWCVTDYQNPEELKHDGSLIFSTGRYSYDYRFVIYDSDTHKLYLYGLFT